MPLSTLVRLLVVAGLVAAFAQLGWVMPAGATTTAEFCADTEEAAFLTEVNVYRAANGKAALTFNLKLSAAAEHHSVSMATNDYFSHDLTPEGKTWDDNVLAHGYAASVMGENIAAGNDTASETFVQWKNSPTHNANMLDTRYAAIGIGRAYGASATYGWYWTTTLGSATAGGTAPICGQPTPVPTTSTPTRTPLPATASASRTPTLVPSTTPTNTPIPPPSTRTSTLTASTGTPTNSPAASATSVATVRPGPETPAVTLSKEKSKYNGLVEAQVRGVRPDAAVTLQWPDGTILATGTAGGDGRAALEFRTPLVALGTYRVEARDAFGHLAATTLSVIPRILLNEESGPTTTRLRVYFYGFAPGERVEVRWYALDEAAYAVVVTVEIAPNGRGSSLVTIPPRSPVGPHKVMGRVVGVSRSASDAFIVTAGVGGSAVDDLPRETATPTVTPTASPSPVATAITATQTAVGSIPGDLPAEPTSTPTPSPVATGTQTAPPTATATTPEISPTSTPEQTPAPAATSTPEPTVTAISIPSPTPMPEPAPDATRRPEETPTP